MITVVRFRVSSHIKLAKKSLSIWNNTAFINQLYYAIYVHYKGALKREFPYVFFFVIKQLITSPGIFDLFCIIEDGPYGTEIVALDMIFPPII